MSHFALHQTSLQHILFQAFETEELHLTMYAISDLKSTLPVLTCLCMGRHSSWKAFAIAWWCICKCAAIRIALFQ